MNFPADRSAKAVLEAERLRAGDARSTWRGLLNLAAHFLLYALSLGGAIADLAIGFNIVSAIVNGVMIALLFIIGHDACHGALVPQHRLNRWIGRLAFVPCVHTASLWIDVHNKSHHRYTNLKGADGVWEPMAKAEYDAATPARRWLERLYRSPAGSLVYYYGTFWPGQVLLPIASAARAHWQSHLFDCTIAISGFLLTLSCIGFLGHSWAPQRPIWITYALGWVLPYAVWNALMGFTTYLNHTHQTVAWFDSKSVWRDAHADIQCTTNIQLPAPIFPPLYANVMAHTAHHVHPYVPAYALPETQAALSAAFGAAIPAYKLTLSSYLETCRICKLYDFKRRCWTDFDGNPTSGPL